MGLRLPDGFQVEATDAWRAGLVEIQDEGSQLLAIACDARAGMTVVDLCAGAGGKTMAMAAELGNSGRLIARDTDRPRLSRMTPRLDRAGIARCAQRLLAPSMETPALYELKRPADLDM